MTSRTFLLAFAFVSSTFGAACSTTAVREQGPEPTVLRSKDSAHVAAELARITTDYAVKDDPSRSDVRSRVVSSEGWNAVIELTWKEKAPNTIEALDDAPLHVVRRFAVRGHEVDGAVSILKIEAIAPKPWEVTGEVVACIDGRSHFLEWRTPSEEGRCVIVPRGGHLEPLGESILVPASGPVATNLAYRVQLPGDRNVYWVVPARECFHDVEFDDGSVGHAVGTCSDVGDEEPTLFQD